MKRNENKKGILRPADRTRRLDALAAHYGLSLEQTMAMRLALTPPKLVGIPHHGIRGRKTLGRIQQITNRRGYKTRRAA